ncbi:MAG: chitobiase/beta-hexosaminidase C-terminal domain-containing protein [Muribaculaceae bacterium]|nr:chitobiase/beta-hexosaminidase C-terminal domain-containing protein [Muribaculaceae bacterium]
MKKILSLLLVCMCAFGAFAAEKTFTASADLLDGTVDGFTFLAEKNNGGNAPIYHEGYGEVRIYAKGSFTITNNSGTNITNIVFNLSDQGKKRLAPITANVGAVATQALGDETVTWTGGSQSVKFTVGDKADYGSDGNTKAGQLCFTSVVITYEDGGTITIPAPTFNPAGGTFYAPVNVTINGATGATIYYTTDGNDPTTSSAVYSEPINISQNTTLKAIAVTEEATSAVASATYTFESVTTVANIAAYYDLGVGAFAAISNPVTVFYANGNYVWVKDATGYLLIYGRVAGDMNYKNGDIIPGGFGGYLKEYNGLKEMSYNGSQDLFGFQAATAGDAVNPEVVTTAAVVESNFGHYVTIENATLTDISGKNFTVNDAAGTAAGFNQYSGVSLPTDGGTYNITGIISIFVKDGVTTMQLQPTAFEKVVNLDDLPKVDNIAGLLATDAETDVMFNNPVTAVYQSGNQLYINDASGFMLVYGHLDNTYSNGDQLSGIAGNWKLYNGMTEMIPIVSTFVEGTPGTPVEPALITVEEIDQSMIHNYLRIENCTLDSIAGSKGRNFTLTDETGDMIMRLNFNEVTIGEDFDYEATYNIEGFLAFYASANGETQQLQLYPNLIEKVGGTVVVPGDVDGDGYVTAADVTALYNWMLSGDDSALVNPDQDGDGNITAGDVTAVYNILLGQ